MRCLPLAGHEVRGLDVAGGDGVDVIASVSSREPVRAAMDGVDAVLHTAALHKPHIGTHSRQDFVETNITGTAVVLEEAVRAGVRMVVCTSTTSVFGTALTPAADQPAAWITEDVAPKPRNIYGVTKLAGEGICEVVFRDHALPIVILRTSRFFPERDDVPERGAAYDDLNLKTAELLYRRADLADVVSAHIAALDRAAALGFGRYIVSATSPFAPDDLARLRGHAPAAVARHHPEFEAVFAERGWRMLADIDRVYVNDRARAELGWEPRHTFGAALAALSRGEDPRSELARTVGAKGYHDGSVGVYTRR